MSERYAPLLRRLGYAFQAPELLTQALTHRSFGARHNERLEFLGDAVVNLVMADALHERFPRLTEGELTRLRARLVRAETLAALARELELGTVMRLGGGELKSGGYDRDSILADAFEAVIGAIYRDGGYERVRALLMTVFATRLAGIEVHAQTKDAKTRLQELLQGRGEALPQYEVCEVQGSDRDPRFRVLCRVVGLREPVAGEGTTRRQAEQDAAARVLSALDAHG